MSDLSSINNVQVLVIDDDQDLLEMIRLYLTKLGGYHVVIANSAIEGLDLHHAHNFDAIVCDYEMPNEDGIMVLKRIRGEKSTIPFILFTGKGREEIAIEALNSGADFYLQKGGDPRPLFTELSHKIRMAVDRRRGENALRESESKFRALVETSPDTIWEIDHQGNFTYISPTVHDASGYCPDELIGRSMLSLLDESSREVIKDRYASLTQRQRDDSFEVQAVHKNGDYHTLEIHSVPVYDNTGKIHGYRGIARDITERKRLDAKLAHSHELLGYIITNARSAMAVHDRDLKYLFVSDKYLKDYKVNEANIIGKHHYEVFPDLPQKWRDVHKRSLAGEILSAEEDSYHRDDGTVDWTRWECRPWYESDGSIGGIIVNTEVITERKRIDDIEREHQAQLAEAMVLAKLVNWEFDVASNKFTFNDRFFELYGTTATEEGTHHITSEDYVKKFVHPDDVDMVMMVMEKAMKTNDPNYRGFAEHRIVRKDGEVRYIVVRFTVTLDDQGKVIKTKGANQDITERIMNELAIKQANRQLNLLSSITRHDIKNRIMAILAYVDMAKEKEKDPNTTRMLEDIKRSTLSINSSIEFTRAYQDLGTSAHAWLRVRDIISNIQSPEGIQVAMEVEDIEVYADPMLSKVFSNLLDNSIRHGHHVRNIRVSSQVCKGDVVIVWDDDGVGVNPSHKERIFERGYGQNTGYGLFLSREILNITNIKIRETGEPGKGARFEIKVPQGMWRKSR